MTSLAKIWNKWLITSGKIVTLFMILPIIIAFIRRKELNKPLRIFYLFCISKFLFALLLQGFILIVNKYYQSLKPYLDWAKIEDTNFLGILPQLANFILLGWYFYLVIPNNKIANGIKLLSTFLAITTSINYLFIEGFRVYGLFNPLASSIFCFLIPSIHLWFLYRYDYKVKLSKNPYFWIALGLTLPNLIAFFEQYVAKKIYDPDFIFFCKLSIVDNIFYILGQILFVIAFYYAHNTEFLEEPETT